jgi:hypothetical protein
MYRDNPKFVAELMELEKRISSHQRQPPFVAKAAYSTDNSEKNDSEQQENFRRKANRLRVRESVRLVKNRPGQQWPGRFLFAA